MIYVRQSTLAQLERNTESTARQYDLVERAVALGWPRDTVQVIDADLGVSGSALGQREGFESLVAEIALGQVGIIVALEVSRLARDNTAWYRLLDLAGACDTLVADADGVYHPGLFNDRLVLGMKGIMSEAELHVLRARLQGGIRNKASRGELRTGLPVGLVWGESDGEIVWHPDEAVTGVLRAVFDRFAACGSVRATWLWLREQDLRWPLQCAGYLRGGPAEITWVEPTYHAIHTTLTHPAYAGAYVFGRTRQHRYLGKDGQMRARQRRLRREEWEVLITDHHPGFLDWDTYQANQARIGTNIRPQAHQPGTGAVREGCALLQGLATCGTCGRKLAVFYRGPAKSVPGYYCQGSAELVEGKGARHMSIGGQAIDAAVAEAFLAALQPTALQACLAAAQQLEQGHDTALAQHRRQVEQARYQAGKAERRYRAVDPDNRLVARGLETEWNAALQQVADAEAELVRRETARPKTLTPQEKQTILALGDDLGHVWSASTTTDKDRKRLLRSLLEEANITAHREGSAPHADVVLRWKGGAISELAVPLRVRQPTIRTAEGTIDLLRRLAVHYSDAKIAGILNRQGRRTARELSFTASRVQSLRHHWKIDCHQPGDQSQEGELLNVTAAATQLGIAPSTLLRWLNDGFVAGEQITPGAPWRIRLTDDLRGMLVDDVPEGWLALHYATRALGVSRQTVLQRVKRGELQAVLTRTGRRKGLRINVSQPQERLF
ncbi:MAG TPA: recombinase family protein [Pseudonocardiaceae bacterium]|nr:recombinase family protein [Pseudonocardiaceae bacterium]